MPDAKQLDLTALDTKANPYPAFAALRTHDPIHALEMRNGQRAWLIMRYEDAIAVLKDQRFIKDFRKFLTPEQLAEREGNVFATINSHMLSLDPPNHTRLRALINLSFTPRLIEHMRPRIQEITNELIDTIEQQHGTEIDLIDAFAFPLPITVITEILGVPSEDRQKFRTWSNTLLDGVNNPESFSDIQAQMLEFGMYLHNLIETKRQQPTDDLVGHLIEAEADGDKLNEIELISMIFLLLVAGHETTVNLISNGTLALLQHPEQKRLLQNDPALIKNAVEEFLRFHSPVARSTSRWVGEDLEFGGQQMRRGDYVEMSLASANHDSEMFTDPDELDLTRTENRHVAFGHGIHYCLGAPLARLEGQIAIGTLFRRLPDLRLAVEPEQLVWRPSSLLFGLTKLPVMF